MTKSGKIIWKGGDAGVYLARTQRFRGTMMTEQVTEDSIRKLVDRFYSKVRADKDLAPVFIAAIGTDNAAWGPHLQKMYAFWSSVMLTSGRYHGNPLQKHRDLPAFDSVLFDRWLELFAETAAELHDGAVAALYIEKSHRIAESLKLGLYFKPGEVKG